MDSLTAPEMEFSNKKPMWVYPKSLGLSPSQRWGHSACYFHGVVYIFGGCCGGLHFSDVLALNLTTMTWTTLATTGQGPGPRDSHSAIVAGHKMVVFGGTDGSNKVNDLHTLDLLSKEWSKPVCNGTPPKPRESHTSTLIGDNRLIIFGGSGEGEGNYLNDLHLLDLKNMRWSSLDAKGEVPIPRDSHGSVSIGSRMFVYGGDCGDRYNGDVYVLDTSAMTWSRMVTQGPLPLPGVRAGHAMVNIGTQVYVVGGVGDKCYYNDVWVLDVVNNVWTQLDVHGQKPQGRFSHTAIVANSDIAIYGGCGEDERPLDELMLLRFGACLSTEQQGSRGISACKMYRRHWNGKRRFLRGFETNSATTMLFGNNVEASDVKQVRETDDIESKQSVQYGLDMLRPKRMRKSNSKNLDMEIELVDCTQLPQPQLSSSSHSDQEQVPSATNVLEPISYGFPMFKHRNNHVTRNLELHEPRQVLSRPVNRISRSATTFMEAHQPAPTRKQFAHAQSRTLDGVSSLNMVGSDVHGKVDGAFDSGYLMTAVVNGRIFRGVLFSPAQTGPLSVSPSQGPSPSSLTPSSVVPVAVPIPYSNSFETSYSNSTNGTIRRQHLQASQVLSCPRSLMSKASSQTVNVNEKKMRCDLEGVVLTLGGPGSSLKDCESDGTYVVLRGA